MVVKIKKIHFFSCHGAAFRIMIMIIFANPFAGTEWICTNLLAKQFLELP